MKLLKNGFTHFEGSFDKNKSCAEGCFQLFWTSVIDFLIFLPLHLDAVFSVDLQHPAVVGRLESLIPCIDELLHPVFFFSSSLPTLALMSSVGLA